MSLENLQKSIEGSIGMTAEMELMVIAFQNNVVPAMWKKVSYPALMSLPSYVEELLQRVTFYQDWVTQGPPRALWISAFFFPQGFLTAVLQQTGRRYQTPALAH